MKTLYAFVFACFFLMAAVVPARATATGPEVPAPTADMTAEDWVRYSGVLVDALSSGSESFQISAMRLAIQYDANVDVSAATVDLMRIYRTSDSEPVRRLAAVALGTVNSRLARNYLRLSLQYERSEPVRKTIKAILSQPAA